MTVFTTKTRHILCILEKDSKGKDKIAISWSSACAGAKKGNFPPHDGVSERLWTAIHLPEIPTRNYKASEHWGSLEHAPLGKGLLKEELSILFPRL